MKVMDPTQKNKKLTDPFLYRFCPAHCEDGTWRWVPLGHLCHGGWEKPEHHGVPAVVRKEALGPGSGLWRLCSNRIGLLINGCICSIHHSLLSSMVCIYISDYHQTEACGRPEIKGIGAPQDHITRLKLITSPFPKADVHHVGVNSCNGWQWQTVMGIYVIRKPF